MEYTQTATGAGNIIAGNFIDEIGDQFDMAVGKRNTVYHCSFRDPLRKLEMLGTLIRDRDFHNLSLSGRDSLGRLLETMEHMKPLLEKLSLYSAMRTAQEPYKKSRLSTVATIAAAEISDLVASKEARIDCEGLGSASVMPRQIGVLFLQLIENSLRFSHPERVPIIVIKSRMLRKGSSRKRYCHIRVSDNGIGFDNAMRKEILELFTTLHHPGVNPGSGIGLAICRRIVENHGGRMEATGLPGEGTTIDIQIPQGSSYSA